VLGGHVAMEADDEVGDTGEVGAHARGVERSRFEVAGDHHARAGVDDFG